MAARRLIILIVILLGISTLLAAALPDRVRDAEEERSASESAASTATEADPPPAVAEAGSRDPCKTVLKCFEIDADQPKLAVIPLEVGDQLVLEVESSQDDLVEIGGLGFVDVVGPGNPATFDVFVDQEGEYGISLNEADRTIGRIEVTQPARGESAPASAGDRP